MKKYTREELINICEKSFVSESKWHDRDSQEAQKQLGKCYALLKDGCDFKIINDEDICKTDENTIWLYIYSKGFQSFELGAEKEEECYYLPTLKRLEEANGNDWY